MCRSIKVLRNEETPAGPGDIEAAALQFVRKISGFRSPSRANQAAFEKAVGEIAGASQRLLHSLAAAAKPPAVPRKTTAGIQTQPAD